MVTALCGHMHAWTKSKVKEKKIKEIFRVKIISISQRVTYFPHLSIKYHLWVEHWTGRGMGLFKSIKTRKDIFLAICRYM